LVIKGGYMSRIKKEERQQLLREKLNISPFTTDEELATYFGVSVPTIRLDRLALGIPELRERIKAMAQEHSDDRQHIDRADVVGDVIDLAVGQYGISVLRTTKEMLDRSGYVEAQYLYAQANSLARAIVGVPTMIAGVGNIKYKSLVKSDVNLAAKAELVRQRGEKFFIKVTIKDTIKEVFRAKFIMESVIE
jgi:hypothetical protein